jgi:hypothetical protein
MMKTCVARRGRKIRRAYESVFTFFSPLFEQQASYTYLPYQAIIAQYLMTSEIGDVFIELEKTIEL